MGDSVKPDTAHLPGAAPTARRVLWRPSAQQAADSRLADYVAYLVRNARYQRPAGDGTACVAEAYVDLWQWSTTELGDFWSSIADYFEVNFHQSAERPYQPGPDAGVAGARWFPGGTLNYAEHALRAPDDDVAIIERTESSRRKSWTYGELRREVRRVAAGLRAAGVVSGDRVAAYLPNSSEAIVGFLSCASLGAIWSSCPPEFGAATVVDRLAQIAPKILFAVSGYTHAGKPYDRSGELETILAGLPSVEQIVECGAQPDSTSTERPTATSGTPVHTAYDSLGRGLASEPLSFASVPFDHPLYILFSSGTTGLPKAIVHGHGGILLEHLKQLGLHADIRARDRFFWYSTTGWMMWNYSVSALLLGATVVLYDGSPGFPDLAALWCMASEERLHYFGTSAPYLMACRKAGLDLSAFDLSTLRGIGSTGAPLPAEGFEWVYEAVSKDARLASLSGGTDVCTGFVGSCPWLPVTSGRSACASLGARVEAFDDNAVSVRAQTAELVLTAPMPSMPVKFWNDPEGERYHSSYFDTFPGVWRHGDWIEIGEDGTLVISGRSDSTLNRGGVRMGTSEFYRVVEELPEISDSLVVDTAEVGEAGGLWLFVVLGDGSCPPGTAEPSVPAGLIEIIRRTIRVRLSPRHVPDRIVALADIPRTLSGKKLEVPIKRVLMGTPVSDALKLGTLRRPESVVELLLAAGVSPSDTGA